ncbi:hypothetical protein [Thalassoroseus pseudoceratinae]|uniref:hypothetical protein n=1 Tax=Thalassoroseus pseudoceratinae TaxID=2713176 RepID=UPI00141FDB1D|nr:hypothetical protein [Thalassoroseus pseudoceratinae]
MESSSGSSTIRNLRLPCRLCLWVTLIGFVGCDSGYYEERLKATADQFTFVTMVNENLAPAWGAEHGLMLRVPHIFQLAWNYVPAKPKSDDEEEVEAEPPPEPPGLEYLGGLNPYGLVGVWTTPVNVGGEDKTAYLFACTNYHLWNTKGEARASQFFEVVIGADLKLVRGIPGDYVSQRYWNSQEVPSTSYLEPSKYYRAKFEGIETPDGETATLEIGNYKAHAAEVVLLLVIPTGGELPTIHRHDRPGEAVDLFELTMDTLRANPDRPSKSGQKGPTSTGF